MAVLASASRIAGAVLKRALPLGLLLIWGGMLLYGERGSPPPFSEGAFLASLVFTISSLSMRLPFIAPHHLHAATLVASFLLSPWWASLVAGLSLAPRLPFALGDEFFRRGRAGVLAFLASWAYHATPGGIGVVVGSWAYLLASLLLKKLCEPAAPEAWKPEYQNSAHNLSQYLALPLYSGLLAGIYRSPVVTPWGAADLLLLFWLALIEGTWGAKRGGGALSKKPHSIVETLLRVLEVKDPYTARHSERTATIALDIAREMGLPQTEIEALRIGALLHDIGKVGVPEAILKKDGPLSEEEWSSILAHPLIGDKLLSSAGGYFKHLDKVRDAILYHHERWDGSGYPEGLKGKEIPLVARIVAVADSYEAMTAKRCYRKAITPEEALEDICRNAGTRYDPEVVRAFVQAWKKDPAWKAQGGKTK
jgi:putative nucleotidyltransferase with HDIG domain